MAYDPVNNEQIVESYAEVFRSVQEVLTELTADTILEGNTNVEYLSSVESWLQFKQKSFSKLFEEATKQADKAIAALPVSVTNAVEIGYSIGEQTAAAELLSAGILPDVSGGFQTLSEYAIDGLIDSALNRAQKRVNKLDIVNSVKSAYSDATESAASLVLSGGLTIEQASEIAVDELLSKGIKTINVGNRKMAVDAYMETSIRTIAGNAQVQGSVDRYEDADQYLSFVTDSPMECEDCRRWEGKILRTTNDLEKIPEKFHKEASLDTAKADKLFHPNCTHSLQVYIDGYSEPPTNTDDSVNGDRRRQIRRLQKLERTNKTKAKVYKKSGSNRAKGAEARAAKYKLERRRLENVLERNSLGWFTGEQRLRRLAESVNIPVEVLDQAKGNLPKLNKLVSQAGGFTGIDPRLISPKVRADVADVLEPPNLKDYNVDNFDDLTEVQKKNVRYAYKQFYESDVGLYNYLADTNQFHTPPEIPKEVKKADSKEAFDKWINSKSGTKHYKNDFGEWVWDVESGEVTIGWADKHKETWDNITAKKLAEQKAAGALANADQVVSGGLPSSGKTFTLTNGVDDPRFRTYELDDYVILNSDDFKTEIILRDYATNLDQKIDEVMSDTFINDTNYGVGNQMTKDNPVYKLIKATHPELADEILNKPFNKNMLTEVREYIVSQTVIGKTGMYGYEAANIVHEESSNLLKHVIDTAAQEKLNIVHDVTMGSDTPQEVIEELVFEKDYNPAEVMFISYSKEQAVDTVVDRYLRGNFDNIKTTARGGRYINSAVLDSATSKINKADAAGKKIRESTIDLFGREALTDNEGFLVQLLESDATSKDLEDITIVNRYTDKDGVKKGVAAAYRLDLEIVDGKIVGVKDTASIGKKTKQGIDGIRIRQAAAAPKINKRAVPIDKTDAIKNTQFNKNGTVKQTFTEKIKKRRKSFIDANLGVDDAGLYIIAEEQGFTGKPATKKTVEELFEGGAPKSYNLASGTPNLKVENGILKEDIVTYRGLSDRVDQTGQRVATTEKKLVAKTISYPIQNYDPYDIGARFYEDKGLVFWELQDWTDGLQLHVDNMGLVIDLKNINKDALEETIEKFRLLNENANLGYIMPKKGFIEPSLFKHPLFQEIYDDVLFEKGINVKEVKSLPIAKTGLSMHQDFIEGDYWAGNGIYGHGTYTDVDANIAIGYAEMTDQAFGYGEGGVVQGILIPKGIRFAPNEVIEQVHDEVIAARRKAAKSVDGSIDDIDSYNKFEDTVENDVGRRLAAMGYQAYSVEYFASVSHIVILDRSAVIVAEQPLMINGVPQDS